MLIVDMRARHDSVFVVGLSMGGALSVLVAAEQNEIPALVLIAPYLGMPRLAAGRGGNSLAMGTPGRRNKREKPSIDSRSNRA